MILDRLFFSKKSCIGKMSDEFLDSWDKELKNTGVNLREVLIDEYARKFFQLITQCKFTVNRQIIHKTVPLREKIIFRNRKKI